MTGGTIACSPTFQLPLAEAAFNDLPSGDQVAACKCARVEDRDQFLELNRRWF